MTRPTTIQGVIEYLDAEAARHRALGCNDAAEAYEDAAGLVRGVDAVAEIARLTAELDRAYLMLGAAAVEGVTWEKHAERGAVARLPEAARRA